ncbi:MAG: hypothetical protein HYZ45_05750 [Burkholderiales bacterium]|nr:hypothetical protein [Burkholderiales bacterium]
MNQLPEPLMDVLRSYCHVEWFELNELADDIRYRRCTFDVISLKNQLKQFVASDQIPYDVINAITLNEFHSSEEAQRWLQCIYEAVFPDE